MTSPCTRACVAALLAMGHALAGTPAPERPPSVAWRPPERVAAGKAIRGPWRQDDSRYDWVDDPAVALSPRGELAVAWVDQGRRDVFLQRRDVAGRPLAP